MDLLLLSTDPDIGGVLPALPLLPHNVRTGLPEASSLLKVERFDVVLVDARRDLAGARSLCRILGAASQSPVVPVLTEGGLVVVAPDWGIADILLTNTGPAELDARLRLLVARGKNSGESLPNVITLGELVIDENTYVARLRGQQLDLTYKEFELLKFLVQHVGRVFTRAQLLQEVWGYDFFGGTRTVDVHIRRLRAKLGTDYEAMIGTVRNVGYKAVVAPRSLPQRTSVTRMASDIAVSDMLASDMPTSERLVSGEQPSKKAARSEVATSVHGATQNSVMTYEGNLVSENDIGSAEIATDNGDVETD